MTEQGRENWMHLVLMQPAAERTYAEASARDQAAYDAIVAALEDDPFPDGVVKFDVPRFPAVEFIYTDQKHWASYYLPDHGQVSIAAVGREPRRRR